MLDMGNEKRKMGKKQEQRKKVAERFGRWQ
jgi:hypothetical protein